MDQIIEISRERKFSVLEAQGLVSLLLKITDEAQSHVKRLGTQIQAFGKRETPHCKALQSEIDSIVEKWESKVRRLGATPKGLWLVDFDSGLGYYCWKFPEEKIQYFHGYQDGFSKRVLITEDGDSANHENSNRPN